nr:MAG TPA: hypothetical protein [Caudoviricetes sp.]DAV66802.1 MAG TPA: hypothetical protein [Bacteriophage sp.]DAM34761.1 MAG TPA: hypothetical protein [Caudoviricetes sp.]DAO77403.1 MAG TPA: hypothetical protein [Caudoviricetes sp.]DAR62982.1 MAG TPA: hypothetical protein [Caudoviricetes sp.]
MRFRLVFYHPTSRKRSVSPAADCVSVLAKLNERM